MNKAKINEIFKRLAEQNPEPKTELEYINVYTLLVAVILSAQATDVGVNKATKSLFKKIDTPEKMVELGVYVLKKYIKTIGLFNSKAKNVIGMSKILIEEHGGQVPKTEEELVKLPGVGVKTAKVLMNCAFGEPVIAVDTHVFRVSHRLGFVTTKTPEATGKELEKIIPKEYLQHAHHWLILLGRYTCKARSPECDKCIVNDLCEFKDKKL